jgi:hypothetical protein
MNVTKEEHYRAEIMDLREEILRLKQRQSSDLVDGFLRKTWRAWSILQDPNKAQTGRHSELLRVIEELGVSEPCELNSVSDEQLQYLASFLRPVQQSILMSCLRSRDFM